MVKRIRSKNAFFLNTERGAKVSGSFGEWGHLSRSPRGKFVFITLMSRPTGNPNPVHKFSSTNQPPRP